jgi:hypothetical protein
MHLDLTKNIIIRMIKYQATQIPEYQPLLEEITKGEHR